MHAPKSVPLALVPLTDAGASNDMRVQTLTARYRSTTLDEFIERYANDFSRDGVFIQSAAPAPIGSLLYVRLLLADRSPILTAVARVAWHRSEPAGMGLRFRRLHDEASRVVLERIVARATPGEGPRFGPVTPEEMAFTTRFLAQMAAADGGGEEPVATDP